MYTIRYRQRQAEECERRAAVVADLVERGQLLVEACEWRLLTVESPKPCAYLRLVHVS
jgi:hypothetical protein